MARHLARTKFGLDVTRRAGGRRPGPVPPGGADDGTRALDAEVLPRAGGSADGQSDISAAHFLYDDRARRRRRRGRDGRRRRHVPAVYVRRGGDVRERLRPPHLLNDFRGPEHERELRAGPLTRRGGLHGPGCSPSRSPGCSSSWASPTWTSPGSTTRRTSGSSRLGAPQLPARVPHGRGGGPARRRARAPRRARLPRRSGFLGCTPWPRRACCSRGRTPASRSPRRSASSSPPGSRSRPHCRSATTGPGRSCASGGSCSSRSASRSPSGRCSPWGRSPRSTRPSPRRLRAIRSSLSGRSGCCSTATPPFATRASTPGAGRPSRWRSPRPGCSSRRPCSRSRSPGTGTSAGGSGTCSCCSRSPSSRAASGRSGSGRAPARRSSPTSTRSARSAAEEELSVLFADLQGFTTFAERTPPDEVRAMLDAYFSAAAPVIEGEDGRARADRRRRAPRRLPGRRARDEGGARSALRLQEVCATLPDRQPDWPRFRVGVNSGEALVGLVQAPGARSFTPTGDVVNTGARLEQ